MKQDLNISDPAMDMFFQMSPDLFCIAGTDGFFHDLNPAWESILGFSKAELMSKPLFDFIHPDDVEPTLKEIEKQIGGQETINFVNRYKCSDGSYKWLEWRAKASEDRMYLYAVARDITERKRLDDEIKQQADLLNLAHDSIIVRDMDSRITFWNQGAVAQYGWTSHDALGKTIHEFLNTGFPKPLTDINSELLKNDYWEGELTHTRKDGTEIIILSRWQIKRDVFNQPYAIFEINNNITDHKKNEARINQIEARFHSAFDLPLIGIALTSPEKGWIEANKTLQQMLGYSLQELDKLTWADLTYPDDIAEDERQFNKVIDGEIDNYSLEKRFIKKNGEIIWTIMSAGCVRKPDGTVDYFVATLQDISRQKEVEISLRESENKFRTLVENIGEGIGLMNNEEIFVFSNPSAEKIFGVEYGKLEGICLFDFLTEATICQIKNETSKRNQGISSTYELELQLPNGSKKEILVTATPWYEGNKIVGTFGIFRDITLQKKAENALRESKQLFHNIFESHGAVKMIIDPLNGNIVDANIAASEFYGYSPDRLKSMNLKDISIVSYEKIPMIVEDAVKNKYNQSNFQHRLASGEIRDVEVYSSPIEMKGQKFLFAIIHDDTDRQKAIAALLESEEKFRSLAENSDDMIGRFDGEYRHLYANSVTEKYLGLSPEIVTGKTHQELGFKKEEYEYWDEEIEKIIVSKKPLRRVSEFDQGRIYFDWSLIPEFDSSGNVVRVLSIARDITELIKAQNALKQSDAELRELNATKDKFFSIIAHDLRSPFNAYLNLTNRGLCFDYYGQQFR